ncbi:MAG: hypothetical protein D6731_04020 [Planctomycetota bacterium]|nr:MAG: hypothetical protein D6731_04020 [Planctomycetota bacterium]
MRPDDFVAPPPRGSDPKATRRVRRVALNAGSRPSPAAPTFDFRDLPEEAFAQEERLRAGEGYALWRARRVSETPEEGLLWLCEPVLGPPEARRSALERKLLRFSEASPPGVRGPRVAGFLDSRRPFAFVPCGGSVALAERIRRGPAASEGLAELARPLLETLGCAHRRGLTHGLLGPETVRLDEEERPVVLGLGLLAALREEEVDPSEDVRALGGLFLQLLAGALEEDLGPEVVRLRGLELAKPPLWEILVSATGPRPFRDAEAFLEALRLSVPSFGEEQAPSRARGRWRWAAAAAGAVAVVAGLGLGSWGGSRGSLLVRSAPGAKVELSGVGDLADVRRSGRGDAEGFARFEGLPPGRYVVVVHDGKRACEEAVEVRGEETSALTVGPGEALGARGVVATLGRTREAAEASRCEARELLADGSLPERYGRAEAAYREASRLEAREAPLLSRLEAWERARRAFFELLPDAREADPRRAVAEARASAEQLARRLARAELEAADARWAKERLLRGPEGFSAARAAAERYRAVGELAAQRDRLATLLARLNEARRGVETLRAEALRSMADVALADDYARADADTRAAAAEEAAAAPPDPVGATPAALEALCANVEERCGRWEELGRRWSALADRARDVNAVHDLVAKLVGAISRKDLGAVLRLYEDPGTDRYFFETTFRSARRLRLRVSTPTLTGDEARAEVSEFSYDDSERGERVELPPLELRLFKGPRGWRVRTLRPIRR